MDFVSQTRGFRVPISGFSCPISDPNRGRGQSDLRSVGNTRELGNKPGNKPGFRHLCQNPYLISQGLAIIDHVLILLKPLKLIKPVEGQRRAA